MNVNKIKSLLASIEFDILDDKSIKIEKMANDFIEEKSMEINLDNNVADPVNKMAARISSVLVRGNGDLKNSIHYGYLAIGAILGAKESEYISQRISLLMSRSILSNKDEFLSKTTMGKISFLNETYYRFIPAIKQNELGKERQQRFEIKTSTLEKLGDLLSAEGMNINFISHAIDDVNKELKLESGSQLSNSSPSMSMGIKK